MWFKTRVGLISIQEPTEILIGKSTDSGPQRWWIYARLKAQQEGNAKGILGQATFTNPISYLAMFMGGDSCQQAISGCMAQIEASIQAGAKVCDLSEVGDAQAWSQNWRQVQWQS